MLAEPAAIAVFVAFYTMLGSAIELRHASWLWLHDLANIEITKSSEHV